MNEKRTVTKNSPNIGYSGIYEMSFMFFSGSILEKVGVCFKPSCYDFYLGSFHFVTVGIPTLITLITQEIFSRVP